MKDIADRVKYILETEGLTYGQFAERIGVAASAVSHFVNRRNKPSLDAITGILTAFPDISPDWLLLGTGALNREDDSATKPSRKAVQIEIPSGRDDPKASSSSSNAPNSPSEGQEAPQATQKTSLTGINPDATSQNSDTIANPLTVPPPDKPAQSLPSNGGAHPKALREAQKPARIITLYADGTFDCYTSRGQNSDADQ